LNLNLTQSNLSKQPLAPSRPYIHHLIGSHSQYGEDLILSLLFNGKNKGFYVDVGANDPDFGSNTKRFYLQGWHGINIEPDTKCFNKIRQYRENDINLNIAVGKETGQMKFYNFPDDPTISSLDLETAQRIARTLNLKFSEIVVDVLPLADVFEKYAPDKNIDFLSVDAEGYDIDVLKSNNWVKWRPSAVMVEIVLQEKKIIEYMHSIGYLHIFSNQVNSIFIDVMSETNLNHIWKKTQSNARHG
jgi:FkbM family methyltransferase